MASVQKIIFLFLILNIVYFFKINGVIELKQSENTRRKRDVESNSPSSLPVASDKCLELNRKFNSSTKPANFGKELHLDSDQSMLQLTWTGKDHEKILIVTSSYSSNTVWLSQSDSSFTNISSHIFGESLSGSIKLYLLQHHLDPLITYICTIDMAKVTGSDLYISLDAAESFKRVSVVFSISPNKILFHPTKPNLLLALDDSAMMLYLSKDKGFTWQWMASDVTNAKWSKNPSFPDDIFIIRNTNVMPIFFGLYKYIDPKDNVLYRLEELKPFSSSTSTSSTSSPSSSISTEASLLKRNVFSIGSENVFLYASIIIDAKDGSKEEERIMQVSTDGGRMWNRVQLPTITSDRFYSILDLSEGLIFLHVDNPGDTGRGVLYTSDATGLIFSKSLENHLYPNFEEVMDFYRVKSSNGTYLTSILAADDSVKTVISFDRGTEWHPITRPAHVPCHNESRECFLHIHNQYSQSKGINAASPLSVKNAPGLIIAHGHVAESLQTSDPDVYVSNDGGHTWIFALKGPHRYQIADHGNLIFAIPTSTVMADTLYFSTDRGRCWVSHKFTDEKLIFKEILVTPDNLEKSLAVWGYTEEDKKWHSFVFDFADVVTTKCTLDDFDEWSPLSHRKDKCVLGVSATFRRPKPDSWCLVEESFSPLVEAQVCQCTEDDYKCDYGFKRNGELCERDVNVVDDLHICLRNHHQKIVPLGYHKIPGDNCEDGFSPPASSWIDLSSECKGVTGSYYNDGVNEKKEREIQKNKEEEKRSKGRKIFFIIFFFSIIISTTVVLVLVARKYKIFKRQPSFKYSSISATDEGNRLMDGDDDDDDGGADDSRTGYNKIQGPSMEYENQNLSPMPPPPPPQQTGYVHPKLLALTNPHLLDNNNNHNNKNNNKKNTKFDDDVKLIAESDVELID